MARVAAAVSSTLEMFEAAAAFGAELLVVHHGLFWDADGRCSWTPSCKRRLKVLFAADGLAAYHLPLDGHRTLGNNAVLAGELGVRVDGWFDDSRGAALAVHGRLAEPLATADLAAPWQRRRAGAASCSWRPRAGPHDRHQHRRRRPHDPRGRGARRWTPSSRASPRRTPARSPASSG